ncbi:MAG: phage head-tail connector protein [Bacillaceae bacterium]|nr:phage head-tail connector protein [Bacillaceae bacterium]
MDSLTKLHILLDEDDFDLLEIYFSRAVNHIKSYCRLNELDETQTEIAEDIAIFNYRNKGVENIVSEGKGSLSESYRNDLPPDIIRRMNEHRRMKFV